MQRILLSASVLALSTVASNGMAAAPSATPDILWYTFNEAAGSTTTANLASPGIGLPAGTIFGHSLNGSGQLVSTGLGSGTNYVGTGWGGASGNNSFSIYFELTNPAGADTTLNYFFGASGNGSRAFDDGVAGDTGIGYRFFGNGLAVAAGATTPSTSHEVAFVWDASVNTGYAYVDGVQTDAVTTGITPNTTTSDFKVAGYSTSTFVSPKAGTLLNDFRVYGRALSASEFQVPEPTSLALISPLALMLRRRR